MKSWKTCTHIHQRIHACIHTCVCIFVKFHYILNFWISYLWDGGKQKFFSVSEKIKFVGITNSETRIRKKYGKVKIVPNNGIPSRMGMHSTHIMNLRKLKRNSETQNQIWNWFSCIACPHFPNMATGWKKCAGKAFFFLFLENLKIFLLFSVFILMPNILPLLWYNSNSSNQSLATSPGCGIRAVALRRVDIRKRNFN